MSQQLEKKTDLLADIGRTGSPRQIAMLALGTVQALRHESLTIEQAWEELFNVGNYARLRERGCDKRVLRMFSWALELPNVKPLGERALRESYDAIERLAEEILAEDVVAARDVRRAGGGKRAGRFRVSAGSGKQLARSK